MKYAVVDTETSGLFDFSKPADADGQPRLAHLAMILLGDDLSEESAVEYFVKPDGWEMSPEVVAINGLTTEILAKKGIPISYVLLGYTKVVDAGYVVVAWNSQYDLKVMRGELRRAGMDDRFEKTPNICAMRAATDVCKIPKAGGRGYKFPKLTEACAYFDLPKDDAHTAMGDARAALAVFRKLHELGALPEPDVHYAKNPPVRPQETGAAT